MPHTLIFLLGCVVMIKNKPEPEITVVACYPGKFAEVIRIQNTLEAKQSLVHGYIQAIYPFDDEVAIVCNEEGKLQGLDPCRALFDENGGIYDIIVGPFLICGLCDEGFASLTQEQQQEYLAMFRHPQMFISLNGELIAIPIEEG